MRAICFLLLFFNVSRAIAQCDSAIQKVRVSQPFLREESRAYKIKLQLTGIYIHDSKYYLSFTIHNKGTIDYPIDFIRLWLAERSHAKRSSMQEVEIVPTYADTLSIVKAKSIRSFCLVIPQFTIAENKQVEFSIFELNGARNLSLHLGNRLLFMARPL